MGKLMKGRNATYYLYLAVLIAIGAVWGLGNMINKRLLQLPIQELPQVTAKSVTTDTKSFYPVWAKQVAAKRAEVNAGGEVDDFFKKREESKPAEVAVKPQEPDYQLTVRKSAFLQSIADNGAVINGRFYAVGAAINELAILRPGGAPIIPILSNVAGDKATIVVGKNPVVIELPKQY